MARFGEDPTTRVLRADQLRLLPAPARAVASEIVRLSTETWAQTWRPDAEHVVWRAAHHDGANRTELGFTLRDAARLRALADAAQGWVAWSTNPIFIPMASWLVLHRTWCERHPE